MEKNVNGMVNQMNRITASFSALKMVLIAAFVCIVVTAIGCVYLFTAKLTEMQQLVYVIDNGNTLSAHAQDQSITRKDEVIDHVKKFHYFMFNVPPDRDMIQRNMEEVMKLADRSAFDYYQDLQERGFYKRLISTNSYQQINIEAIEVDMEHYPYTVAVKASQYITRESNMTRYVLVTRCKVSNAVRNPTNLHGLFIEKFEVVENSIIETRNR